MNHENVSDIVTVITVTNIICYILISFDLINRDIHLDPEKCRPFERIGSKAGSGRPTASIVFF